jgi:hypothetical protein
MKTGDSVSPCLFVHPGANTAAVIRRSGNQAAFFMVFTLFTAGESGE